jgi:outer membrane protein TolC
LAQRKSNSNVRAANCSPSLLLPWIIAIKGAEMMKLFTSCLALMLFASSGYAMNLAEMQKMALMNRPLVEKYNATLQQSEKDITIAKSPYLPSVDASYTMNKLNEDTFTENEENSVAGIKVSANLFSGFRDQYNLTAALSQKEAQQYNLAGVREDIQLQVALAYLDVFERRAHRDVAETAYKTLDKAYKDGESRFQVGLIGKNELLKFRVDFDNADITLKAAEAAVEKSVNSLSRQIGQPIAYAELDFADFQTLPTLMDKAEYTRKMLENRSEIKALEKSIDALAASAEAQKGGYYPRVDAIGSYGYYDDDFIAGHGVVKEDEWRAQLVMSMNLFAGRSTEASVAKAKLATRSLEYDLKELKDTLVTTLNNLHIDFRVSLENVEAAKRSIEQAEENLRITQLKYEEGLQRESDLLDAIASLSRAKYNHVAAMSTVFNNNFQMIRMVDGF